ncbi:hypothetical protein [Methylobacterium persicinum]|uniref:Uncharacterized protein n=1 Tax=Methylobacterium persicinum TaxID=374426 RepID=A0ABU0HKD3_9HYPH|nr:hypothetical protein [Methylobacterium persicinum]MDQ0442773.1 hypothetical protein [Methylobacterium persicinum]GJE36982.1 hypothetical protein KHHGKMAE_1037 [Methylobacterium persicinum]
MDALFTSGRIVDFVLGGVLAEAVLLVVLCRGLRRFAPFAATLAAGAALMLALRAALTGAPWPAIAGWMLVGLAAHCVDLALRRKSFAAAESPARDAWPQGHG